MPCGCGDGSCAAELLKVSRRREIRGRTIELALPALAPAFSRRPRLLSLWRRRPGGRRRFAWPSTRRIGRGHQPGPALALLEQIVKLLSLLGREDVADFFARLAKFPAQFRL